MNIASIIDSVVQYKGYIALAAGWIAHVYIPHLVQVYPYISANGGVFGIVRSFLFGRSQPSTTSNNETTQTR